MCCGALCHHDHLVLSVGDMYFDGASRGWEGGDCPNNEKWSATDACLSFFTAENRDIWGKNGRRGIHVGRCEGICIFMHFRPSNCGNKRYMCFKVLQTSDNEAIICFIFKLICHLCIKNVCGCTNKMFTMMLDAKNNHLLFCQLRRPKFWYLWVHFDILTYVMISFYNWPETNPEIIEIVFCICVSKESLKHNQNISIPVFCLLDFGFPTSLLIWPKYLRSHSMYFLLVPLRTFTDNHSFLALGLGLGPLSSLHCSYCPFLGACTTWPTNRSNINQNMLHPAKTFCNGPVKFVHIIFWALAWASQTSRAAIGIGFPKISSCSKAKKDPHSTRRYWNCTPIKSDFRI